MNMNKLLLKIAKYFEKKKKSIFNYPVSKQRDFLKKLGETDDNIQRSFLQYKCQKKLNGFLNTVIYNFLAVPLIFFYIIKYYNTKNTQKIFNNFDAVFFREGKPSNILPNSLRKEFKKIEDNLQEKMKLTKSDIGFIAKIISKYPFSYFFILKNIIKIAKYRYTIDLYNPKAIIVCSEFSFTSSLLTEYCHFNNIIHINVMHGEKLYYMRDSYFHFDRCYVWDEYYKELLISLNAEKNQFIIEVPDSMKISKEDGINIIYDYTYYLGGENYKQLKNIGNKLEVLSNKNYKISVRPHPRYSNLKEVSKIFEFANIENCGELLIEDSLNQTKNAISLYSTVLNQALNSNIDIVIDDISNPIMYSKLLDLEYICVNKKHKLLSEILMNL